MVMKRRGLKTLLPAALLLFATLPAVAQTTTGRILGTVTDEQGAPLPGVTVTVSSDALLGGTRTAETGDTGAYRFAALPPGVYSVAAELDSFQPQTKEGLQVTLSGTATADFVLYPTFAERVTVSGDAPLVDVTSSSAGTTFTADFIKDLPTTRNFYDMMTVAPGVSLGAEDSSRVVSFGSDVQSNAWYTDGIEVTGPETGTGWVSINPDMIQEIQVMGIGAPAEFGNMLGAALNVVTKSGSNNFKGSVNAYWFDDSLVDSNIKFDQSQFSEYSQKKFWDATATLGGPLKKDRLWYLVGYEYWRDGHAFPGSDPEVTPVWYQDRYDLKLSSRVNDSNLIDVKAGYNKWGYPDPASAFTTPSASAGEVGDDTVWGLNYQSIFSDKTYFELRYSGWKSNDDYLSQTGSTDPAFIDYNPPGGGPTVYSGGVWYPWTYDTSTDQGSVSVSHFADDFIKGDHDFKFGVQANKGDAVTLLQASATGTYYYHYTYDYYGYTYDYYVKGEQLPYFYGAKQNAWAAFIDDSWALNDRLTINLGVRFDHNTGITPSFDRLDAFGNPTGQKIPGVDPVFTWNDFSPRVGFAYNLGAERKTVVRGSFGVYYDGNVSGNWDSPPPFPPTLTAYFSSGGPDGPYDIPDFTFNAGGNNVDPGLQAPKTLQYALGFERELKDKYSYGVMGVYKDTTHGIGWEFLDDGVYQPAQFTDPFNGREYTVLNPIVFPTVRKGNKPGYTAAGYLDDYWSKYWGVVLTFNRRFADWWSMQASYTYSKSTGLNPRALSQWQNNPLYGSREGSSPNQWFNVDGATQTGDRPHMLRVSANFELPWNLHANTNVNLQSGRPYFREVRGTYGTNAGRQDYFIAEEFRHPFQSLVDFSIGKRFKLGDQAEMKLDLQFFNLLNNDATDFFETTILDPGETLYPTAWVKPRRVMLRLGFEK
jgi:Carboxypeptidase regulatory-like domain/TonB-dependent Receptor Plug Domain